MQRGAGPGILFLVGFGFDVSGFFGSTVLAYVVWGVAALWATYLVWGWIKRNRRSNTQQPRIERTGVRTQGGRFRSTGTMRIRNQDRSIDSEDTDWETKDTDIE